MPSTSIRNETVQPTTTTWITVPTPGNTLRRAATTRKSRLTSTLASRNDIPVAMATPLTSVEKPSEPRSAVSSIATPTPSRTQPSTTCASRRGGYRPLMAPAPTKTAIIYYSSTGTVDAIDHLVARTIEAQ